MMMHSDDLTAAELLALQRGGLATATEFFERDRHRLLLFVKHRTDRRLLGRLDWEDVLQESYLVVQRRLTEFLKAPRVSFYVWIRAITGQVLIDLHRRHLGMQKRTVHREVSLHQRSPFQSTSAALGDLLSCSGTSPSGRVIRNETYTTLMRQMDELSDCDREVLVLRHMEQLTNGEVAHVLGIGKAAATKRYLRALQRLRHATAHLATS